MYNTYPFFYEDFCFLPRLQEHDSFRDDASSSLIIYKNIQQQSEKMQEEHVHEQMQTCIAIELS